MKKPPQKRIRLNAEVQRDRILKAAMGVLSREGFIGLSFQKIANQLSISQSAVLYHFSSKEGLITGVLNNIVAHNHQMVSEAIRGEDNGVERLRKHFELNLAWAQKNPDEAQISILLYYFSCSHEEFSEIHSRLLKAARQKIVDYLLAGQREGLIRKDIPVELTGQLLHDALLGGIINAITSKERLSKTTEIRKKWELLLSVLLVKGIRNR